ncbi:putative ABC transport system permease protein [Asanoa ferruginea]|uniref:Putative ABC transport system permease protein n=1 Tax=Asanoa ferruginea TaxID=53367 RepID=A0A3D9ZG26_9ACTN|nr:putative ABC transport system permease protein [Asanoa ferruginea]GIF47014.1 ABC transporter permease [Asanoa ferruginea]
MRLLTAARLGPADLARLGVAGLRSRPLRAVLAALGIAIGIAAMTAVVGVSASSRAELHRTLDRLGTNLLTVGPGTKLFADEPAELPVEAPAMVGRIGPVTSVSATGRVDARVYRTDRIPAPQNGSIAVVASYLDLPATVGATVADGVWLNAATARYPAVVLGATAAARLGAVTGQPVWLGDLWFTVVGVLAPVPLAPELDSSALVGWDTAAGYLGFDGHPTTIYTRAAESSVEAVAAVLANTANPESPTEVQVSRPSDALVAGRAADDAFTGLLLGLGAVALLVGGVGVANTMVISVLERRGEIGLRRALGATRGQIRAQFLAESLLLCALGGVGGVLLGIGVTTAYAMAQGWPAVVPAWASLGAVGATLVIGAVAGLYPAVRAARLAPTSALAH